jgi:hypothetical protein
MDKEGEKKKLEDAAAFIAEYQNHAITQEFDRETAERESFLLHVICEQAVVDLASIVVHFQSVGELQGLRRRKAMLPAKLEEIKDKIKEL